MLSRNDSIGSIDVEPPLPQLTVVLAALADPVRLEIVRRLAATGEDLGCAALYDGIVKSTASHHFSVLRAARIITQLDRGGRRYNHLERDLLERVLPGLLTTILNLATIKDGI